MNASLYAGQDEDEVVSHLDQLLDARHGQYSFYRDYWGEKPAIERLQDFREVPSVDSDDLSQERGGAAVVLPEAVRNVSPRTQIISSGSTGVPKICFRSPADRRSVQQRFETLWEASMPEAERMLGIGVWSGVRDTAREFDHIGILAHLTRADDIALAATLTNAMRIDTILSAPSVALELGKTMDEGPRQDVRYFLLTGGLLSTMSRDRLNELFPNASIAQLYGAAETGPLGYQCPALHGSNSYHTYQEHHFYEVIDPDTGEACDIGETGELIITSLTEESALPLVRYRTGDLVTVQSAECDCEEGGVILHHRGRREIDVISVKGMKLYGDRIEDALRETQAFITKYQLHVYEEKVDGDIRPRIKVEAVPRMSFKDAESAAEKAADTLMGSLQVTEGYTWRDGVEAGLLGPITVEFVEEISQGAKWRRIVDHRGDS